jgi:trimethylamine:corrinoid methyltransferase-like protein
LDTSPEAMALDVIKEVGPRGQFLLKRHTRYHLRRRTFSDLTARQAVDGNFQDPLLVARDKADWILKNHHPEPLQDIQMKELTHILNLADTELG